MKRNQTQEPVFSLASFEGLTIPQTAKEFAERVNVRRRAFVEQGKLVHHLRALITKRGKGQSVYAILQGQGVAEGSVQQAVTTADLIDALVIPQHLTEARFDEVITFRIARFARKLIQGKAAIQMTAADVAAILRSGESASIGAELECLSEHGMTIAQREQNIVDKAIERQNLEAAAAEAGRLRAEEEKRKAAEAANPSAPASPPLVPTSQPAPQPTAEITRKESESSPAPATTPEPQPDSPETPSVELPDEEGGNAPATETGDGEETGGGEPEGEPEPLVIDGTRGGNAPQPPPSGPTLVTITNQLNETLTAALDLPAEDLQRLVGYLRSATNDIAATLDTLKVAVA